ncbi:MAG TPA: hypothetical protein VG328_10710 [Stellaceae bacterium]|jgi:hypothetical protein|nr:hypothetical protein [Stellaceae bacterium]
MAERKPEAGESGAENPPRTSSSGTRSDAAIAPDLAPNMLVYADISRMLFRMHRNVSAHMDAHKRLAERMQSVFSHEQAMVLELARLIDQSTSLTQRPSTEDKPPLRGDSIERIFDHARNAMQETGRMMTEIQLESLALLQHYVTGASDDAAPAASKTPSTKTDVNKGTDEK